MLTNKNDKLNSHLRTTVFKYNISDLNHINE